MFLEKSARQHTIFVVLIFFCFVSCSNVEEAYYENGNLRYAIEMEDGRYNGEAVWYYPNGLKQQLSYFVNDTLQGKSTRWYNNGKRQSVEHYMDNHLHGLVTNYDPNGKKISEEHYHMDTLHGPSVEFYTSGQPRIEGAYFKGLYDGKWFYYEDDGTIVGMGEFNKGNGRQRAWYRNGNLKREVNYLKNEKNGKEIWYNPQGDTSKILLYDTGQLISTTEF